MSSWSTGLFIGPGLAHYIWVFSRSPCHCAGQMASSFFQVIKRMVMGSHSHTHTPQAQTLIPGVIAVC